jgi:hypothetical protein
VSQREVFSLEGFNVAGQLGFAMVLVEDGLLKVRRRTKSGARKREVLRFAQANGASARGDAFCGGK